jgi:hypothetical protein
MSNETQKVIKINPELFKLPTTGTTRRMNEKKIRVKDPNKTGVKTVKNTVNRSVLNHIRAKQSELFDTLLTNKKENEQPFLSDFDKAMQHMESTMNHPVVPPVVPPHNRTVKNTNAHTHSFVGDFNPLELPVSLTPANIRISPQYGCLRGGKLPTYRTWKKTTSNPIAPHPIALNPIAPNPIAPNPIAPILPSLTEIQQTATQLKPPKPIEPTQQKKTFKRKYHVGKSKYYSKIGVLISNRTIRTQTVRKTQQIKQTPLTEIKRTLVKKGLIKVGTTAPPDVLRKMYESISLLVGDVENHNLETILHNYINDNNKN